MGLLFILTGLSSLILMTSAWLYYRVYRKAQVVDCAWALSFVAAGAIVLLFGSGDSQHRFVLFTMIAAWSLRLTVHLLLRVAAKEDERYAKMRERMGGDKTDLKFFAMFWFQGCLATFLTLPFFIAASDPNPGWTLLQLAGIAVYLIGFIGETIADRQLKSFKQTHSDLDVCNQGLWRYSRHPNYFFEWVIWIGFALFATASSVTNSWGYFAWTAPALIYYLLVYVSGIPPLEKESLSKKGGAYRVYQQKTSAFFPWFIKS